MIPFLEQIDKRQKDCGGRIKAAHKTGLIRKIETRGPMMAEVVENSGNHEAPEILVEVPAIVQPFTGSGQPLLPATASDSSSYSAPDGRKDGFRVTYERAKNAMQESLSAASQKSVKLWSDLRHRSRRLKEEQPLQMLGVIGGIALVAGIGIRIWRSSRYE